MYVVRIRSGIIYNIYIYYFSSSVHPFNQTNKSENQSVNSYCAISKLIIRLFHSLTHLLVYSFTRYQPSSLHIIHLFVFASIQTYTQYIPYIHTDNTSIQQIHTANSYICPCIHTYTRRCRGLYKHTSKQASVDPQSDVISRDLLYLPTTIPYQPM